MDWYRDYVNRFYVSRPGWAHGTKRFHDLCARSIPSGGRILEVGAGPSNGTSLFLSELGEVDGVDLDPLVLGNEALGQSWVIEGDHYPCESGQYDACVSNYVLEHVSDPQAHLREIHRILKPGGCYVFRTPNRFHYVSLVAALTPHSFHHLVANRLRALDEDAHDPYPTLYRLNSRSSVKRHAPPAGFEIETLDMFESTPSYGAASRPLFFAGLAYERTVSSTELLAGLRANLLVALRKTS
jgi:SAM-dependent methyltransferase